MNRKKIRTLLTLLGVAIGIALLVSVTGFGNSLKDQIQQTVTKRFDLVIQSKGAAGPLASRLTKAEYEQLISIPGIAELPAIAIGAIKTDRIPYFLVAGASSLEPLLGNVRLLRGRLLQFGNREVLMGYRALERFKLKVNDFIELNPGERFQIVGSMMTGSRLFDQGALLDLADAQRLLRRQDMFNLALIRLELGRRPAAVIQRIGQQLPQLEIMKSRDLLGEIRLFIVVDKIAWGLSAIALIISSIFVINTLIMSVSERTKEIGILMAIGWSRAMIVKTIFLEAFIVCVLGGVIGTMGGWGLLWIFSQSDVTGLDWAGAALSVNGVVWAAVLSFSLGLVSAIYPAIVASRMTPAQALRYE